VVVSIGKAPGWAVGGRPGGVALQPAGCAGAACNGYTQSSAGDKTNEMYVFGQKPTSPFAAVGPRRGAPDAQGAGQPAPFLAVQLRNRGATLPADAAAPIVNLTVSFTPLSINGDAPPSTEAFSLTLGVMWTPGEGAKPNAAALFALVPPLPSAKFTAYGVAHQFQV
jgi:hypothetical protein